MKHVIRGLSLSIFFLLISCKTGSNLAGKYETSLVDNTQYTFNTKNHKYSIKINGNVSGGKFKVIDLSLEKSLIICNEVIFKKISGLEKELDSKNDSVIVGVYDGYKISGQTVFEITLKSGNLSYRKTYLNELEATESKGELRTIK